MATTVSRGISHRALISVNRSQDIDCRITLEALVSTAFPVCRGFFFSFLFKFTGIYLWFLGIVGYTRARRATGALLCPISPLALANIDPIEQGGCNIIIVIDWLTKGKNRNTPNFRKKTSKNS